MERTYATDDDMTLPMIIDADMNLDSDETRFFSDAYNADNLYDGTFTGSFMDTEPPKHGSIEEDDRPDPATNSISSPESMQDSSDDYSPGQDRKMSAGSAQSPDPSQPARPSDAVRPSNWRGGPINREASATSNSTGDEELESSNKVMEMAFDFNSAANTPSPYATNSVLSAPQGRYLAMPQGSPRSPSTVFAASGSLDCLSDSTSTIRAPHRPTQNGQRGFFEPLAMNGHPPGPEMQAACISPMQAAAQTMQPLQLFGGPQPADRQPESQLYIHLDSAKTRVETQVNVTLRMYPPPRGIKRLRLPENTIGKPKLFASTPPTPQPDMLELSTTVVCSSAMEDPQVLQNALTAAAHATGQESPPSEGPPKVGAPVSICEQCMDRERKRSDRKKNKKAEGEARFRELGRQRILIFNTAEVQEWQHSSASAKSSKTQRAKPRADDAARNLLPQLPDGALQLVLPTRIACYCRHYEERVGFRIIFTLKDHVGRVVAQKISPTCMITDDHKKDGVVEASPTANGVPEMPPAFMPNHMGPQGGPTRNSYSSNDLHALQMQPLPSQVNAMPFVAPAEWVQASSAPPMRLSAYSRRASPAGPEQRSKKRKSSSGAAVIPDGLRMTTLAGPPAQHAQSWGALTSPTTGSPFSPALSGAGGAYGQMSSAMMTNPSTPDDDMISPVAYSFNGALGPRHRPAFSLPGSSHGSRAPSPSGPRPKRPSVTDMQVLQAQSSMLAEPQLQAMANPTIVRVIPPHGPIRGGIDVTILGSSFHRGLQVMFGNCPASTSFWAENTLICRLPPALISGTVPVTLFNAPNAPRTHLPPVQHQEMLFKYEADDEEAAVQQIMRILARKTQSDPQRAIDQWYHLQNNPINFDMDAAFGLANGGVHDTAGHDTEGLVLQILELIDLVDSDEETDLNLQGRGGQGLLHIAASLGFIRLVAGLLARGANPDLRDRNGLTPMHLASLRGHVQVARKLRAAKADSGIRSLRGFTPADMAWSGDMQAVLLPPRSRSHSAHGDRFLRSRANSLSSPSVSRGSLARQGSLFGTSLDGDDEASNPPRGANSEADTLEFPKSLSRRSSHPIEADRTAPVDEEPGFLMAWRDSLLVQIQHYQDMAARSVPNLQLPNLPTMRNLPENYQGVAFWRPFAPRSGASSDVEGPSTAKDPPAYSDLFPSSDSQKSETSRTKRQAAWTAARETLADSKCETLFDQPGTSTALAGTKSVIASRTLTLGKGEATAEELQRFRAERAARLKPLKTDLRLYLFWLPVLAFVVITVAWNRAPHAVQVSREAYEFMFGYVPGGLDAQVPRVIAEEV